MKSTLFLFIAFQFVVTAFVPQRSSSFIRHIKVITKDIHPAHLTGRCSTNIFSSIHTSDIPRISNDQIKELNTKGYVIIPDFLSTTLVSDLRSDIKNLRSLNKFKIAKIGQDSTNTLNTNIRVAETCFLGKSKLNEVPNNPRETLYDVLDQVRQDLSGNSMLDTKDPKTNELVKAAPSLDSNLSELLYAYYPNGGFYRRHVDAVANSASVLRSYSLLCYLNDDWQETDGGQLRIHLDSGKDFLPSGEAENYIDVKPLGGTLVLFKSDQIPHEVLNTNAERYAVVGWYNRPLSSADVGSLASEQDKMRGMMLMVAAALVTAGVAILVQG